MVFLQNIKHTQRPNLPIQHSKFHETRLNIQQRHEAPSLLSQRRRGEQHGLAARLLEHCLLSNSEVKEGIQELKLFPI